MRPLTEAFFYLTIFGFWMPQHWKSKLAKFAYRIYSLIVITSNILMGISLFIALFTIVKNKEDLIEILYVTLTITEALMKYVNLIWNSKRIVNLADKLMEKHYVPQNDEEVEFCAGFQRFISYSSHTIAAIGEVAGIVMSIMPYFLFHDEYSFPLRCWYPYEIKDDLIYWYSYAHQAIAVITITMCNASNDLVICGFIYQVCIQLELLGHRLQVLPENVKAAENCNLSRDAIRKYESEFVKRSVRHHLFIIELVKSIESNFGLSIFMQYSLSTFVLCMTIYKLTSVQSDTARLMFTLIYLTALSIELFIFCWFGNEVILKSLKFGEEIFKGDWTVLSADTLKGLLFIMLKSSSPIAITCGPLITLTNDSYIKILKMSYSAFSVMRRSS